MSFRLALRTLLRSRAYALTAIATIALTIALGSTVFAIVDGVLFKPLPFPDSDRLFGLLGSERSPADRLSSASLSMRDVRYLQEADSRIHVAAARTAGEVTHPDRPDRSIPVSAVGRNFFEVLGQRPLVGSFRADDYSVVPAVGAPTPAIVSHAFWQERLGADPGAVGQTLRLVGGTYVVAGVLPRDFLFPFGKAEILVPLVVESTTILNPWARSLNAIARVDRTVSVDAARTALDAVLARRVQEYPPLEMSVSPGPYVGVFMMALDSGLGRGRRPLFGIAFTAAMLLILLGAINFAGLFGARVRDRARELSIRSALGARRAQLVGVLLADAVLVSVAGAIIGAALAGPLLTAALTILPEAFVLLKAPAIDLRVLIFAGVAAVGPVLVFALAPAIGALRGAMAPRLAAGTTSTPRARVWPRSVLLAGESTISIVLVLAGSLVLASYIALRADDTGFDAESLAVVDLQLLNRVSAVERNALAERAFRRIEQVPGVRALAAVYADVMRGGYPGSMYERPEGALKTRRLNSDVPVSGDFFEVAGLRLLEGRFLTREETDSGRRLAVVSEAVAREYWPSVPAVGQVLESSRTIVDGEIRTGRSAVTIVGVVEDARFVSQSDVQSGEIYIPASLGRRPLPVYLLRTTGDPGEVARDVALAIRSDVPGVLASRAESFDEAVAKSVRDQRFRTVVFALTGSASLLLVAVGIAGLVSNAVARRVREIGVRSALGARRRQLVRMIVIEHVRPVAAGVALGLVGSWWTTQLISTLLYKVDAHEPWVWAAATAALLAVATLAAWLPARRASAVEPNVVLRAE